LDALRILVQQGHEITSARSSRGAVAVGAPVVDGPVEMVFRYYPKEGETVGRTVVYKGQNVLEA
jgi:hypothetical protein